jgi:hypothetical protein
MGWDGGGDSDGVGRRGKVGWLGMEREIGMTMVR